MLREQGVTGWNLVESMAIGEEATLLELLAEDPSVSTVVGIRPFLT